MGPTQLRTSRYEWICFLVIGCVCAILLHWSLAPSALGWLLLGPRDSNDIANASSYVANSFLFAIVGFVFFVSTVVVDLICLRGVTGAAHLAVANMLVIPMSIRLAVTFLVFAILAATGVVSKGEAAVDVLFWYVSLTATELVGIVLAFRRHSSNLPSRGN